MVDPKNQSIHFNLKTSLKTQFIKIRTIWDDRDLDNNNVSDYVTFSNESVQKMIRIWTLENERNENYDYDRNSNRKIITENGKNRSYTYYKNDKNGNTARVMFDGKWWYTYDDNGNRTAKGYKQNSDNDKVVIDETRENWKYTWDYYNRLVKVQQFNAPDKGQNIIVEYEYDALNRRIERTSRIKAEAEVTQYAYGRNGAITYRKKENSEVSRTFAYLNNQITAFLDKSDDGTEKLYYTVTDIQGSVTEVYDEEGFLVWKSGYTAFGIKAGETTNLIDFDGLYTGCDYDAETGLTYHWNRWRSEDGDSWLSEDPARDGLNWYGYAGQNPTNYTDRNGLKKDKSGGSKSNKGSKKNQATPDEAPHITGPSQTPSVQPPVPETPNSIPEIDASNNCSKNRKKSYYNKKNGYSKQIQDQFFRMSTSEQLEFLKDELKSVRLGTKEAGIKAKHMRNQLKDCMNLDGLFYSKDGDEVFMNEDLRDFLNINESGYDKYDISEMTEENGWYKMSKLGSKEHQHTLVNGEPNVKYVNIDGRKAIFDSQRNHITKGDDVGTFNYGTSIKIGKSIIYGFTPDSSHGLYDMNPFFKQQQTCPSYWISVRDSYLRYGWQRELRGEW